MSRFLFFIFLFLFQNESFSKDFQVSSIKSEIQNKVESLITKYCPDQCELIGVEVEADLEIRDISLPGFEENTEKSEQVYTPNYGKVRILIDEVLGQKTKQRVLDLIKAHTDGFGFPIQIDTRMTKFPQSTRDLKKVNQLKKAILQTYQDRLQEMILKFCPEQCILAEVDLQAEAVNPEEVDLNNEKSFYGDGDAAIEVLSIQGTLLLDEKLSPSDQVNLTEMAKMAISNLPAAKIQSKTLKFPENKKDEKTENEEETNQKNLNRSIASVPEENSEKTKTIENNLNQSSTKSSEAKSQNDFRETIKQIERIERVENDGPVMAEMQRIKEFGIIFFSALTALLLVLTILGFRKPGGKNQIEQIVRTLATDPVTADAPKATVISNSDRENNSVHKTISKRFEIDNLRNDLMNLFAENPKVAKTVFSRVLPEEGIEVTARYIDLFGESIVLDLMKDPSLQDSASELLEFYAKNPADLDDDDKLVLLKALHNRAIAAKMLVMSKSTAAGHFDFLIEMDAAQVSRLLDKESNTIKAVVMTQLDPYKRSTVFEKLSEQDQQKVLNELSRIDHLPKDYIYNVATALRRKKLENPALNTEALPGADVLVSLLEKTDTDTQKRVIRDLESNYPESAHIVRNKFVSIDTLRFLRDGQLLEVVLSLQHKELIQFLKGVPENIKSLIFSKAPDDLVEELVNDVENSPFNGHENYINIEKKIINRIRLMSKDGTVNLEETNQKLFEETRVMT